MASDLASSLKQSASTRQAMLKKFGMVPLSILKIARGELSRGMFLFQQENFQRSGDLRRVMSSKLADGRIKSQEGKDRNRDRDRRGLIGGCRVVDCTSQDYNRVNASTMPDELVAFFIKYYSRPGETYLDPFMGQGVRMQVAKKLGLHYHGYDLSTEFFAYVDAVRRKIDDGKTTISITHGDSKHPDQVPNGIGDFSFHSPPYWDIEFYGSEAEQLGYGKSYPHFLDGMEQVARAWLPKFKPGAWHVVNVNDFRKEGKYYPYHADTIGLFQRAGWTLCDTWIIEGLVGGLPKAFAVDFNLKRIAPKIHEYALVFRKPRLSIPSGKKQDS